jgi:hypothetical protein
MIPRAMPAVALLLVGPPLPDRSKVMTHTKRDPLVLQVGGYEKGQLPIHVKNTFTKKSQRRNGIRQINVSRLKRVTRNMSSKIHKSASRTVVNGEMS